MNKESRESQHCQPQSSAAHMFRATQAKDEHELVIPILRSVVGVKVEQDTNAILLAPVEGVVQGDVGLLHEREDLGLHSQTEVILRHVTNFHAGFSLQASGTRPRLAEKAQSNSSYRSCRADRARGDVSPGCYTHDQWTLQRACAAAPASPGTARSRWGCGQC